MRPLFMLLIIFISVPCLAQEQQVPYTLADRDRMISLEANVSAIRSEMNSLRNEMNSLRNEMNSLRNEMNSLRNEMNSQRNELMAYVEKVDAKIDYIFWLMGFIAAFMVFILGYMIWDRRTAMAPVNKEIADLKNENATFRRIFRKLSETQPQIKEFLKNAGIL